MELPNIKDLVKDNRVRFLYYRKGELWYEVCRVVVAKQPMTFNDLEHYIPIFTFPVPVEDCGDGQFNVEDKAITFMRYIRKYLEVLEKEN